MCDLHPASRPAGFPSPRLKGLKCRTDRGFMHPAAATRGSIRRPSFATSLPGARLARTRWSGPRGCRAGSGPGTFPAGPRRIRRASFLQPGGPPSRLQPAVMPAAAAAVRCRSMSVFGIPLAQLMFIIGIVLVIPSLGRNLVLSLDHPRLYVPGRSISPSTASPSIILVRLHLAIGVLTYGFRPISNYLQYRLDPIQAVLSRMVTLLVASESQAPTANRFRSPSTGALAMSAGKCCCTCPSSPLSAGLWVVTA